jgi:hypothetical protein
VTDIRAFSAGRQPVNIDTFDYLVIWQTGKSHGDNIDLVTESGQLPDKAVDNPGAATSQGWKFVAQGKDSH